VSATVPPQLMENALLVSDAEATVARLFESNERFVSAFLAAYVFAGEEEADDLTAVIVDRTAFECGCGAQTPAEKRACAIKRAEQHVVAAEMHLALVRKQQHFDHN
jgi:hypothetical protein